VSSSIGLWRACTEGSSQPSVDTATQTNPPYDAKYFLSKDLASPSAISDSDATGREHRNMQQQAPRQQSQLRFSFPARACVAATQHAGPARPRRAGHVDDRGVLRSGLGAAHVLWPAVPGNSTPPPPSINVSREGW
jgi:hypothetical protein